MSYRLRPPVMQDGRFYAPSRGYDVSTAAAALAPDRALMMANLLPGTPGRVRMRGPLQVGAFLFDVAANNPGNIALTGIWSYDDKVALDPAGSDNLYVADLTSGTNTVVSVSVSHQRPSGRGVRVGPNVYGATFGVAQAQSTNPVPRIGTRGGGITSSFMRWDGTAVTAGFVIYAQAPFSFTDVAAHLQRVFVLGGTVPGAGSATTVFSDRLYWTDPGGPTADTLAMWQDDVTGLTNQIVFDGDGTDYGVALARTSGGLLILRRRSTSILSGSSPSSFSVRRVLARGCRSTESVVEYDGGAFFLSDDGYVWFDGSTARVVSRPVQPHLMAAALLPNSRVVASMLGADSVIITTFTSADAKLLDVAGQPGWTGVYHIPSDSWVELSSGALYTNSRPVWVGNTANFSYGFDGRAFFNLNAVMQPDGVDKTKRGFDVRPSPNTNFVIPAELKSRAVQLALPARVARLQRLLAQHVLQSNVVGNGNWSLAIEDSQGNVVMPAASLASLASSQRQLAVLDVFNETQEAVLHWIYQSAGPGQAWNAEIHDSYLEFDAAQDTTG